FVLGDGLVERDAGEPTPFRLLNERSLAGALADEREGDARIITEGFGGVEDLLEALEQAVGADVGHEELGVAGEPLPHRGRGARRVEGGIGAVDDDGDLLLGDSAVDQVLPEALRHDDDRLRGAIGGHLHPREDAVEKSFRHHAGGDEDRRPEVPDFKDERRAAQAREYPSRRDHEEGRRADDDYVGPRRAKKRQQDGGDREGDLAESALPHPPVRKRPEPATDDADPFVVLFHDELAAVLLRDDAQRMVRQRRHHGHLVAFADPDARHLGDPRRQRPQVRRKPLRQPQDLHSVISSDRRRASTISVCWKMSKHTGRRDPAGPMATRTRKALPNISGGLPRPATGASRSSGSTRGSRNGRERKSWRWESARGRIRRASLARAR